MLGGKAMGQQRDLAMASCQVMPQRWHGMQVSAQQWQYTGPLCPSGPIKQENVICVMQPRGGP